jgi:tricorn protease
MRRALLLASLAAVLATPSRFWAAPDADDTRLLSMPAVSKEHIAFVYAGDLWACDLKGENVRRLTRAADPGSEAYPVPCFSPDGRTLAFSGHYNGNFDVYTIPVAGGIPTRLTWHPGWDFVRGWTGDGSAVLFVSQRELHLGTGAHPYTVTMGGGFPTPLPVPHASDVCYSPDGARVAYTPQWDMSREWKNYRGGMASRILIMRLSDCSVGQVPQPATRCNDTHPCWVGDTIYFRSDRNGEFNLFAYQTMTKSVQQLTHFEDFPVISVNAGGGNLVFEQAGYIHLFDPRTRQSQRLRIGVPSDLPERRPRFVQGKGTRYVRNGSISPSGARAVFEFRGEIITVPAAKGDARNLTNTPGVHERSPAWSPDGASLAYFSDAGGEYSLHVRPADGKGKARAYKVAGAGFYEDPVWSPDSKKIAYVDNAWTLYFLDLANGEVKKVAAEPILAPSDLRSLRAAWSPDSNWIAYALGNKSAYRLVYVYSLAEDRSHAVTDGMSDATEPAFDASGNYLYFFASTDAGPVNAWFNLSRADMRATRSLYLALLRKDTPSPLIRQSDEEKGTADKHKLDQADAKQPAPVKIDFDGLDRRLLPFPLSAGDYRKLRTGAAGVVLYLAYPPPLPGEAEPANATLMRYDLTKPSGETLVSKITSYGPTPDGKKALIRVGETLSIVELNPGADPGKGKLKMEAMSVRIEPAAEWQQIFDEAWRINRDYFYDPGMHGADWPAMKKKYAAFLPHVTSTDDLYRVIRWMLSELSVSHSRAYPDEEAEGRRTVPGGLLGADYEIAHGRYRFKKVYGGVAWWPKLRSPLTAPGVNVKAGEYLLGVRGVDLKPPTNLYALFENTADKSIELTVGPNPDGSASRVVTVEPLSDEHALRTLDWVEGNMKKVHDATKGRVAYVYIPDTGKTGHAYFKRYFYSQLDKEAVILDERFNTGGSWGDYYLDHLRRPFSSYWAMRYGTDLRSPSAAILGPKVMLINEPAGSGGDGLAFMFRQSKFGLLIGKRTWGGEVGTLGFPRLMDGGTVTAPNFALWSPEGGWVVENEGVPPDIEVEQSPAAVRAGRDPQLEKAIETIMKELERNSPATPVRPRYPVRVRKPL